MRTSKRPFFRWDRRFESGFLQRRVRLSSAQQGCARKIPRFRGTLQGCRSDQFRFAHPRFLLMITAGAVEAGSGGVDDGDGGRGMERAVDNAGGPR